VHTSFLSLGLQIIRYLVSILEHDVARILGMEVGSSDKEGHRTDSRTLDDVSFDAHQLRYDAIELVAVLMVGQVVDDPVVDEVRDVDVTKLFHQTGMSDHVAFEKSNEMRCTYCDVERSSTRLCVRLINAAAVKPVAKSCLWSS
jgi:hypothetical protein